MYISTLVALLSNRFIFAFPFGLPTSMSALVCKAIANYFVVVMVAVERDCGDHGASVVICN